jgi:hypothetical protein
MWNPFKREPRQRQEWDQDDLPARRKMFWIAAIVIVATIAIWQLN